MKTQYKHLLQRTYLVLVFGFMYLPIAVLIAYSFNENKSRAVFTGFSLKWYASLFHNEMILSALGLSLVLAFVSAIIATVLGPLATIGINSMSRKAQLIINNISYVPVVNPEIITGVSLMLLFVIVQKMGIGGENGVFGWITLLIGDLIELQFLGNSYNLNLGSAMSLVLMVIVLLCMSFTSSFDEEEMEGVM